jgi:hypothetical protein
MMNRMVQALGPPRVVVTGYRLPLIFAHDQSPGGLSAHVGGTYSRETPDKMGSLNENQSWRWQEKSSRPRENQVTVLNVRTARRLTIIFCP